MHWDMGVCQSLLKKASKNRMYVFLEEKPSLGFGGPYSEAEAPCPFLSRLGSFLGFLLSFCNAGFWVPIFSL